MPFRASCDGPPTQQIIHNNTLDVGIRDAEASAVQINPHLYYTSTKYYSSPSAKMMPWMMAHQSQVGEISMNLVLDFPVWKTPVKNPTDVSSLELWFSRSNGREAGGGKLSPPTTRRDGALRPGREGGGHRATFILDGASPASSPARHTSRTSRLSLCCLVYKNKRDENHFRRSPGPQGRAEQNYYFSSKFVVRTWD